MAEPAWAWVIFQSLAKAEQARAELAGTRWIEAVLSDGRLVEVPPVVMAEPVRLAGGRAGYSCHYWAGNSGSPEADEVVREQVRVLFGHARYGAVVTFGATPPAEWVEEEVE